MKKKKTIFFNTANKNNTFLQLVFMQKSIVIRKYLKLKSEYNFHLVKIKQLTS